MEGKHVLSPKAVSSQGEQVQDSKIPIEYSHLLTQLETAEQRRLQAGQQVEGAGLGSLSQGEPDGAPHARAGPTAAAGSIPSPGVRELLFPKSQPLIFQEKIVEM